MKTETTFKADLSGWIAGLYWIILFFLISILVVVALKAEMRLFERAVFVSVFSLVVLLFIFIMAKAYRMKFTVTKTQVIVSGIFCQNIIKISSIKSIQKSPIPFGFRLFGASFLGGWYYLPGIGTAWVTMGNFKDGVLISTRQKKNFVVTPSKPWEFIRVVRKRMG